MATKLSSRRDLITMAIPLIIGSLLEPIASVVDNAFVGNINTHWLAALAFGTMILSSVSWVFNFLIHVSTESISKVFGQGSLKDVVGLTQVSLLIALIIGVATSIAMYIFHPFLFSLIGVSESLLELTKDYFFVRLIGHPFTVLFLSCISLLRGISKVKTTMVILLISTFLNSILNYLFLYVYELGPEYAAWGTNISMFVGFIIALITHLYFIGAKGFFQARAFQLRDVLNFSSKSLNLFVRSFCLTSMFFISTRIAGNLGVVNLAAHQILLQFWLFSSFFIDGVAIVANIYVSRLVNSGQRSRLRWALKECFYQGIFFGLLFTFTYTVGKAWLWSRFTQDKSVLLLLEKLWPLIVWSQVINGLAFVIDGCLFGAGAYKYLRNMMIFIFLFIFLPFAYIAYANSELWYLWAGLIAVSIFRFGIGVIRVNKIS
jgi:multidrug resistance protein, MATE family